MVRFFWMLFFTYILLILQSTIITEALPAYLKPDLMLIWVTYLGILTPLFPGTLLVFFCGFLYDTFSGSPFGLFLVLFLGIFLLIKLLGRFIIMGESPRFRILLVALSMGFQTLGLAIVPWGLGISDRIFIPPLLYIVVPGAVTLALVWPFFRLCERIHLLLSVSPA